MPGGNCSPKRSLSAYRPISIAAPQVKPRSTEGEMKFASDPKRKTPMHSWSRPTATVTVSARFTYSGLPTSASGASMAKRAREFALVGPDTTCKLEPNKAATMQGTTAL
ncbi:hypothetical protein D3C72_1505950 [compost metagenome]